MKGFSSKTQVNNQFKLADLAKNFSMNREEKDEFKQIESITLTHALNSETTGLKATDSVELIYIFRLKLKTKNLPLKFIKVLDKKTKAHTIYEIENESRYYYIMTNKRVSGNIGVGEYVVKESLQEWEFQQQKKIITLEDIYTILLALVLKLIMRPGETADNIVERKKRINELEKEVIKLERKKDNELQFNKKVELNEKIRALKAQIEGES